MKAKNKIKINILIEKDGIFFIKKLTMKQARDIYNVSYMDLEGYDTAHKTFAEIVDYNDEGLCYTMQGNKFIESKHKGWHSRKKPRWRQVKKLNDI